MAISTGQVSFSSINTELGRSSTAPISLNDSDVRRLAWLGGSGQNLNSDTQIPVSNLRGKARAFGTISADSYGINYTDVISSNYAAGKTWATVTINGGVVVGAYNVSSYAMQINGNSGDYFEFYNYGTISGAGGLGGQGEAGSYYPPGGPGNDQGVQVQGTSGQNGGNALYVSYPTQVWNYGNIWGGGGGGVGGYGGATGGKKSRWLGGGGGGGGAGQVAGSGNINGATGGNRGSDGTLTSGGAGGASAGTVNGGAGGGPGQDGQTYGAAYPRLVGGAAGYYIVGSGNISWNAYGDLRGNVG